MTQSQLPSWRPGATRDALEIFLDDAETVRVEQRVAVFDVDGTLWCEKPRSPLVEFLLVELRAAASARPILAEREEYRAALDWDLAAINRLGPVNVVLALTELHAGLTPEAFEARVRAFFADARHTDRGVPISQMRYRPMLELIAELRARDFDVYVVSGAGLEFIRTISHDYFGVKPEGVVGSQVGYEFVRGDGAPVLLRTKERFGDPNEGPARIASIQRLLGRRPMLAAGNGAGDREMLEYVQAFDGPSLALLVDHDDAAREYEYAGGLTTGTSSGSITAAAEHMRWTVVSMKDDWTTVFAAS